MAHTGPVSGAHPHKFKTAKKTWQLTGSYLEESRLGQSCIETVDNKESIACIGMQPLDILRFTTSFSTSSMEAGA